MAIRGLRTIARLANHRGSWCVHVYAGHTGRIRNRSCSIVDAQREEKVGKPARARVQPVDIVAAGVLIDECQAILCAQRAECAGNEGPIGETDGIPLDDPEIRLLVIVHGFAVTVFRLNGHHAGPDEWEFPGDALPSNRVVERGIAHAALASQRSKRCVRGESGNAVMADDDSASGSRADPGALVGNGSPSGGLVRIDARHSRFTCQGTH